MDCWLFFFVWIRLDFLDSYPPIPSVSQRSLPGEINDVFGHQLNSKYQEVLEGRELYKNFLYLTIIERPNLVTRGQQKMAERKKPKPRKPGQKPLKVNPRKLAADKKRLDSELRLIACLST